MPSLCSFETIAPGKHQCRQCGAVVALNQTAAAIHRECTAPAVAVQAVEPVALATIEPLKDCNCNKKRRNVRQ